VATTTEPAAGTPAGQPLDETPLRFVTAASLFDGHDAAINVMRRLIQDRGAEVVHLGHNRSVAEIVRAAIQEDADGIAISSYQGGHTEFFRYAIDMLAERGAAHIRVFGGGGGTITPAEIAELESYGVERIYHPNDGMALGLTGMIDDLIERTRRHRAARRPETPDLNLPRDADDLQIARALSALEDGRARPADPDPTTTLAPVVGITGTGGAGKSTVTDELLNRFSGARRRPDPPAHGRRAAGGPDPDEQPARRADLHALAGHPRKPPRGQRDPPGRRHAAARHRRRPRARRDRRDRPERLGDRRPRRPPRVRDDERVWGRQPA
jgi:methylmalonyl-CoA mutase cobalamin-binding domain/chain